jgi:anaerobic magnesium-protoporphyrin IX monomethyl ester cyclase
MIDILFVHTNSSNQTFQSLSKYAAIEPPIWAALLANSMRTFGVSVGILDCEAFQLNTEQSYNHIKHINPKLVCFVQFGQHPSASAQSMQGTHELLEMMDFEFKTILVGLYPSALPKKTLEDEKCDFVCEGEGVDTLLGLVESDLKNVGKVPRLWYRDGDEIKFTTKTPIIENLQGVLPGMAWDLLPMEKYRNTVHFSLTNNNDRTPFAALYTSLGCPYKCDFCCINAPFGKSVFRYWDPEFIITEFDKIASMGIRNIKIADEMFVLNKNHFLKICDLIIERGYDFNIWAYARVDTVREEYLERLKKAGVNWLALGIESGNRKIRVDSVKGKFREVDVKDIVDKIESFDIEIISNYMFGMSGDTHETMQQTLDLATELNTSSANFNPTMIFPGSPLFTEAYNKGIELPPTYSGYSYYSKDSFPNPTETLSREEILKFRDDAFQIYFNRSEWFDKIKRKFGQEAVDIYKDVLKIKLERD